MENYRILDVPMDLRVVVSVSRDNVFLDIPEIENGLRKQNYVGEVMFEQLLSKGYSMDRFVVMYFDGIFLDTNDVTVYSVLDDRLQAHIDLFYKENPVLVRESVLTKDQQEELLK